MSHAECVFLRRRFRGGPVTRRNEPPCESTGGRGHRSLTDTHTHTVKTLHYTDAFITGKECSYFSWKPVLRKLFVQSRTCTHHTETHVRTSLQTRWEVWSLLSDQQVTSMPSLPAPLSRFIHHCFQPIVVVMVRERAAEGVQRSISGMLVSSGDGRLFKVYAQK